jgi:hypothetical protein
VRPSIASPRICSGAMYCGVPTRSPAWVIALTVWRLSSRSLAMPKSSTRTTSRSLPRSVSMTLSGLRSRWTMPWPWASDSDAAICRPIASARAGGSGPSVVTTCRSERPSRYSIAMNSAPVPSWPKS